MEIVQQIGVLGQTLHRRRAVEPEAVQKLLHVRDEIDAAPVERDGQRSALFLCVKAHGARVRHAEHGGHIHGTGKRKRQCQIAAVWDRNADRLTDERVVLTEGIRIVMRNERFAEQKERRIARNRRDRCVVGIQGAVKQALSGRLVHAGKVVRLQEIRPEDPLVAVRNAVAVGVGILRVRAEDQLVAV